jgi:hypothetical protein
VGSCNIQSVKVAVRVHGSWIEATICDRTAPASQTAVLTSPCKVSAVADRAVGGRVVLCEASLMDAGDPLPGESFDDW